jgi:hypothetical protein
MDRAGDYVLKPEHYQKGLQTLGLRPTVDCFANMDNTKCRRFFAPDANILAEGAAGMDAMRQNWGNERLLYLHPPTELILKVLHKIEQEKCDAILVVPFWTSHTWWSSVQRLSKRQVVLGETEKVLRRGPTMDPQLSKLPPGLLVMCSICLKV